MPASPSLSIIVVCEAPASKLAQTCENIAEQHDVTPEVIVVDATNSDETRAWLAAHRQRFASVASAPNAGRYEAMNRGLVLAQSDWLQFLTPDDRLVGKTILSETLNWLRKTEAGVAAGEVAYSTGRIHRLRSRVNPLAGNFVPRPAAFYRRSLFEENGTFDTSLAVKADYDFHLRLWKNRVRFKPIPLRIAASDAPPLARATACRRTCEEIAARHRYFPAWRCAWWDTLSVLRWAMRRS